MTDERNDQSAPGTSGSGGSGGANEAVVLAKRGNFPEGLRVVVVDDDPLCLRVVERMLIRCSYIGTHVEFYSYEDTMTKPRHCTPGHRRTFAIEGRPNVFSSDRID